MVAHAGTSSDRPGRRRAQSQECCPKRPRIRIPCPPVKQPSASLWCPPTPLLMEEREPSCMSTVSQVSHPLRITPPVAGATFTAGNQPLQVIKLEGRKGPQERLRAHETDGSRYTPEVVIGAPGEAVQFDTGAGPDVFRPRERGSHFGHPLRPLGEHLECVPVCLRHHDKDAANVLVRNRFVKEVRHRVDEDAAGLLPSEWQVQTLGPRLQVEALLVRMAGHTPEPLREGECIAVVAAGRHLGATCHWIPGSIRPLDGGFVCHDSRIERVCGCRKSSELSQRSADRQRRSASEGSGEGRRR